MADEDQQPEQGSEADTAVAESAEITPESTETQVEEAAPGAVAEGKANTKAGSGKTKHKAAKPTQAPRYAWVKPQPVEFSSVDEACDDHVRQLSRSQTICETLMMQFVLGQDIHKGYYGAWRTDANRYFRAIVNIRLRQRKTQQAS